MAADTLEQIAGLRWWQEVHWTDHFLPPSQVASGHLPSAFLPDPTPHVSQPQVHGESEGSGGSDWHCWGWNPELPHAGQTAAEIIPHP